MEPVSSVSSIFEVDSTIREQLLQRRARLAAIPDLGERREFRTLLHEVDSALERLEAGTFGACDRCHDPIEPQRLLGDPLTKVCLGCLSAAQQRDLERDLELAALVQQALLPARHVRSAGWEVAHLYRPLGPVSGDYCDVLRTDEPDGPIQVILGDVSGKGVSASILMAHLQAVFRSLASLNLPVAELATRANHILCEGIVSSAYATLLLGRLWPDGTLEMCNAGHNPPLVVHDGEATRIAATGLPLGLFRESEFGVTRRKLAKGDALFLYTDGLPEATNPAGEQFGIERVEAFARRLNGGPAERDLESCLAELDGFRGDAARGDDLTVMTVRRRA